jgi:hypothetical protein
MSGNLLQFSGSPHDAAMRLLPWLVNGTLDGEQKMLVDMHLQECRICRTELASLHALQAACADELDERLPAPAFARLRARVASERPAAGASAGDVPLRTRLRGWLAGWQQAPGWVRGAVIAQACLLVVVLGVSMLADPAAQPARYRTLGGASAAAVAGGEATMLLVFAPELDQAGTQRLLMGNGARIIDGPTDAGAYVVAVDASRAAAALQALRTARGVQLVEALQDGGRQ